MGRKLLGLKVSLTEEMPWKRFLSLIRIKLWVQARDLIHLFIDLSRAEVKDFIQNLRKWEINFLPEKEKERQ